MHWWFVDGETLNSSEVLLEEVSLGRIVGSPLTEIDTAWASAQGSNGRYTAR